MVRDALTSRLKDFNLVLDDVALVRGRSASSRLCIFLVETERGMVLLLQTHLSYGSEFSRAVEQKQVGKWRGHRYALPLTLSMLTQGSAFEICSSTGSREIQVCGHESGAGEESSHCESRGRE